MSCTRMEKRIISYMDGRSKASEQRDVEAHLAVCPACSLRVNEFRAVSGLLAGWPQIAPSPAFDMRVRARVAAEPVRRSWWAGFAPPPRVALAASMLALALVWMGSRPRDLAVNVASSPGVLVIDSNDLPVLENFDVLSNFEPLTDLPQPVQGDDASQQDSNQTM